MSLAEYDKKFMELSRFAPHMVATGALRAKRFEDGLNEELRGVVKMLSLQTYTDLLNVSLMSGKEWARISGKDGGQQMKCTNYVPIRGVLALSRNEIQICWDGVRVELVAVPVPVGPNRVQNVQ